MRILIVSRTYLPNVGGLERIMSGLAEEFSRAGHQVIVLTETAGDEHGEEGIQVIRKATGLQKLRLYFNAGRILEANISLKSAALGLLFRHKWFVVHHVHYQHGKGMPARIKNFFTRFSKNIAVSRFIQGTLEGSSTVIHNFYSARFREIPGAEKKYDLVFLGRLIADKGAMLLLEALIQLKEAGVLCTCIIIGKGSQLPQLKSFAEQKGIADQVIFAGVMESDELVQALNQCRAMVVPSVWDEPYGVVVLEGLACGCRLIVSDAGGLPEAVNGFGVIFRKGNVRELADSIRKVLAENRPAADGQALAAYLRQHSSAVVAGRYLEVMKAEAAT